MHGTKAKEEIINLAKGNEKMKSIILIILLFMIQNLFAQGIAPKDWGLEGFYIQDAQLGDINYYVTSKGLDQEKPLLFIISGCRGLPIMLVVQTAEKSLQIGTVHPDIIHSFSDQFHVALIGKAGTPFCDTMKVAEINPSDEDYRWLLDVHDCK